MSLFCFEKFQKKIFAYKDKLEKGERLSHYAAWLSCVRPAAWSGEGRSEWSWRGEYPGEGALCCM